jgi:hypothetical protein
MIHGSGLMLFILIQLSVLLGTLSLVRGRFLTANASSGSSRTRSR